MKKCPVCGKPISLNKETCAGCVEKAIPQTAAPLADPGKTQKIFCGEMMSCIFCQAKKQHPGRGRPCGWTGIEINPMATSPFPISRKPGLRHYYGCPECIRAAGGIREFHPRFMEAVEASEMGESEKIPALNAEDGRTGAVMNRVLKRFRREHRSRKERQKMSNEWRFHSATWGDLEVMVMPRTIDGEVLDSNTGVVLKAPFHGTLKGMPVVNDGCRPNCDEAALNYIITGSKTKYWADIPGTHPWCIPHRKVTAEDQANGVYSGAVETLMQARGLSRENAEAEANQVLVWCPDSIQCGICKLLIPGLGSRELVGLARQYGWKVNLPLAHDSWRCPPCGIRANEIPTDEEMAVICGAEWQ